MKKKIKTIVPENIDKIRGGLEELISKSDDKVKWESLLNDLKPQIEKAVGLGISAGKIKKTIDQFGTSIPLKVLKNYIGNAGINNSNESEKKV